ncbi:MAG: hypothetical protein GF331_09595 [Chitinivibrionales bacterium]|nr:hypothetical protein [Chitinivibrionales bacterium]
MAKSRVQDKRSVKLENILKEGYIPFRAGRPARDTVIEKEDVLNLRIALHTAKSLEEFLRKV